MRGSTALVSAVVVAIGAVEGVRAATRPGNDVAVRMTVGEIATAGPIASLRVTNRGAHAQNGVVVRLFANEDHTGPELWSGTVDVLPGRTVRLR
ncbi:MAG TPA: hypothetical protein VFS92_08875, partial [Planctomycetota bacterium]|nr:hypothetical protein [Planctomycetota bacterium]